MKKSSIVYPFLYQLVLLPFMLAQNPEERPSPPWGNLSSPFSEGSNGKHILKPIAISTGPMPYDRGNPKPSGPAKHGSFTTCKTNPLN